jgi:alkanesulfonate monooxygenase SsuD/methylene tetrahydromethanopterin reductase-like flavin-dependent oxidoreductase (luciferase family)
MLGHIAARNRVGRLRLGVGVTDSGRRNPAVTAQAAATLHLLTRGRAILGIGPGEREGNEPYGVDWSKPVARFEEAQSAKSHHPRAVGFGRPTRQPRLALLPAAQRGIRAAAPPR